MLNDVLKYIDKIKEYKGVSVAIDWEDSTSGKITLIISLAISLILLFYKY